VGTRADNLISELRMDAAGTKAPIQHLWSVLAINLGLLVFNLLPIYPLDGGEILSALVWFVLRRAHSLKVVANVWLRWVSVERLPHDARESAMDWSPE
jgi:Zn-dependent protease